MKYRSVIFFIAIIFSLFCSVSFSDTTAVPFLGAPVGARNIGLGGSGVALTDRAVVAWWNPSALALLKRQEFQSTYFYDYFDNRHLYANYVLPILGLGTFGLSVFSTNSEDILYVETPLQQGARPVSDKTFSYAAGYWLLSYGQQLIEQLYIGLSYKFIYQELYDERSTGSGFDIGFMYIPSANWQIGVNFQNFIPLDVVWDTSDTYREEVPLNVKIGTVIDFDQYLISIDFDFSEDKLTWHGGIEYWLIDYLALRAGLEEDAYSVGSTFRYDIAYIDLSITKYNYDLINDLLFKTSLGFLGW